MKIVHLIDYFQPKLGYQETFLAREHKKMGHTVHVVASDRFYPFADYGNIFSRVLQNRIVGTGDFREEGIDVCRLKTIEIPGSPLVWFRGLDATLDRLRPDVVFCHGVYSLTSFAIARRKKKFSLIFDTHAAAFNTDFSASFGKRAYHFFWKRFLFPEIKKNADIIFAIGEEEREFLGADTGIADMPIIRLGVDTNRFRFDKKARDEVRAVWGLKPHDTAIIFAGKMLPGKKTHVLVDAFTRLRNVSAMLILVGGGSDAYVSHLRELAGNAHVQFISFVDNQTLAKYFSAADMAVWPGDPAITMLEAMACRLPLILPERVGTRYLKTSGGVVFANPESLPAVLNSIVGNRQKRLDLGRKAETFIMTQLSWEAIARQTVALVPNTL